MDLSCLFLLKKYLIFKIVSKCPPYSLRSFFVESMYLKTSCLLGKKNVSLIKLVDSDLISYFLKFLKYCLILLFPIVHVLGYAPKLLKEDLPNFHGFNIFALNEKGA